MKFWCLCLVFFIYVHIFFPYIIYFQRDLMCSGVINHSQATCTTVFTCLNGFFFISKSLFQALSLYFIEILLLLSGIFLFNRAARMISRTHRNMRDELYCDKLKKQTTRVAWLMCELLDESLFKKKQTFIC